MNKTSQELKRLTNDKQQIQTKLEEKEAKYKRLGDEVSISLESQNIINNFSMSEFATSMRN